MQTINVGNKRLIAESVPENTEQFSIRNETLLCLANDGVHAITVPHGSHAIGLAKSITEEQWAGIVKTVATMGKKGTNSYAALWRNYLHEIPQHIFLTCDTATESGLSLLQKHGVDPENTLIIEII